MIFTDLIQKDGFALHVGCVSGHLQFNVYAYLSP